MTVSPSLPSQMVAGIGLLTQVQRWRLGSYDEELDDISVTCPKLWAQYEQGQCFFPPSIPPALALRSFLFCH